MVAEGGGGVEVEVEKKEGSTRHRGLGGCYVKEAKGKRQKSGRAQF